MKTHEFKTDKGEFVVHDIDKTELLLYSVFNNPKPKSVRCGIHLQPLFSLSEVTEEDAKGVVDEPHYIKIFSSKLGPFYTDYSNQGRSMMSAKYSLETLLTSKGIDINNGNWYLFKKI